MSIRLEYEAGIPYIVHTTPRHKATDFAYCMKHKQWWDKSIETNRWHQPPTYYCPQNQNKNNAEDTRFTGKTQFRLRDSEQDFTSNASRDCKSYKQCKPYSMIDVIRQVPLRCGKPQNNKRQGSRDRQQEPISRHLHYCDMELRTHNCRLLCPIAYRTMHCVE